MNRRFCVLIAASAIALMTLPGCVGESQGDTALAEEDSMPIAEALDALPPLEIDTDEPLLLDDPGGVEETPVTEAASKNKACYVCHANYETEPLVVWHAEANVGCANCHGESSAHMNDENHTIPPGHMYPVNRIDAFCTHCHESHDIPAAKVVARWQNRSSDSASEQRPVCTTCHGQHRLTRRTMQWNKETGELLTGK